MSLDATKSALKSNSDFGYNGDRDVSLLPGENRVLIETDARDTIGDKRYGVLFQDRMRGDGRGQCPAVR